MDVIEIKEQEDGSALVTIEITEEENQLLIKKALNDILRERFDTEKVRSKINEIIE